MVSFLFRSPVKQRQPCSTGRCLKSFVASLIWPVTPQRLLLLVLLRLLSSAVQAPLSCSLRLAGENCKCPLPLVFHSTQSEQRRQSIITSIYTSLTEAPQLEGRVPTFMAVTVCALPVTFTDLNPDILQVNFNTLFIPLHLRVHHHTTWHRGSTTVRWKIC